MESPSTGGSSCHAARSPTASSNHARCAIEGKRRLRRVGAVVSKWRTIPVRAEMEEAKALAMLEALGLDPGANVPSSTARPHSTRHGNRTLAMALVLMVSRGWAAASWGTFIFTARSQGQLHGGHDAVVLPPDPFIEDRGWGRRDPDAMAVVEEIPPDGGRSHTSIQRAIG